MKAISFVPFLDYSTYIPFEAIVMVGLDGAGKTSILRQLIDQKPGILRPTIRTIGMSSLEIRLVGY